MNAAAWTLVALGAGLLVVAAAGVLRLPDALTRQHAATKAATLALGLMILGVAALQPSADWWPRLGLLLAVLLLTVPVASHALARAAAARSDAARDAWCDDPGMTPHVTREIERQDALARALTDPACYPHPAQEIRVIETHISRVFLTGGVAYKLKKPLDLGFLDFTTLAKRRHFCEQELTLNRRLAPRLYLEVVAIRGSIDRPRLAGDGDAIEYAVKMREFAQDDLLDRVLARGALAPAHVDALAQIVARFHAGLHGAPRDEGYGRPEAVREPVLQNFAQLRELAAEDEDCAALERLERRSRDEHARLAGLMEARRAGGFVRECHGDLHLGNIALVDGEIQIFDCLEFNPAYRWIDVANENAFLTMDLAYRGRSDYAARYLNDYLELTGDYESLALLAYYQVYRALVRAKIALIRARQAGLDPPAVAAARRDFELHLRLALRFTARQKPAIVITHGLAGSGKTTASQALLERLAAVRIRSDVERKRLFGLASRELATPPMRHDLYSAAAGARTYAEMERLVAIAVAAGYPAIADATFLKAEQRLRMRALAQSLGVPFLILDCRAPEALLRERIVARLARHSDASDATPAVLERQIAEQEPLTAIEEEDAVRVDAERGDIDGLRADVLDEIEARIARGRSA